MRMFKFDKHINCPIREIDEAWDGPSGLNGRNGCEKSAQDFHLGGAAVWIGLSIVPFSRSLPEDEASLKDEPALRDW